MVTGICIFKIYIPESNSLKFKRKIIKSILEQVRARFKVAIAEVGLHDLWQTSQIGLATVSNEKKIVDTTINKVLNFINNCNHAVEVTNSKIEFINSGD
jgi:hypothetical protein